MSKNLVIVESPAKAKTIEKFLGKDYHVLSSQGHIRDIDGTGKNSLGVDLQGRYAPNYVIDPQKHHIIATLKEAVAKSDQVWLASDEDREGEAIAWHLQQVLGLDPQATNRIAFHEITKNAIQEALLHPRQINYHLVNAQQARRVLDRIVGFELSPVLWRKITTGLSAGRVQSVAVRLVVEREREIEEFVETARYRVSANFEGVNTEGVPFSLHTELNHRFATKQEAVAFLEQCGTCSFRISQITDKPAKRTPAPPFTTASLQQEAARKLKFTVSKTMRLAQSLYEAGKITYMRTDSVNLSTLAIAATKEEIVNDPHLGARYHRARQFRTSSKGAQEAHEAIRPTYMNVHAAGNTPDEKKLYELIWKRTLACQMADAEILTTKVEISSDQIPYLFTATGEVILFDGFMRAYVQSVDDESEDSTRALPKVQVGLPLTAHEYTAQQIFSRPPYRYNEASLIDKMDDLGIGRPSTYAPTIETIQARKYVERGNIAGHKQEYNVVTWRSGKLTDRIKSEMVGQESQKLVPTDLGRITNDFLVDHFPSILSYDFTAKEEENFDRIANGKIEWFDVVDTFYRTFHPDIEKVPTGKVANRLIGYTDEGEPVLAKISKIGPCIQIGDPDKGKPRFASLKKGQSIYTITLDEALALFEQLKAENLSFDIDGEMAQLGSGKFGPYIRYKEGFISIPKHIEISEVTEQQVRNWITEHENQSTPMYVYGDMQVLQGRYGAYIKTEKGNFRIPRNMDVHTLTEQACRDIVSSSAQKTFKYVRKHS